MRRASKQKYNNRVCNILKNRWRDWVIEAFASDMPFDQFTTWQLAGDLQPNATREQRVASGFNRCNVTTSEGGSIMRRLPAAFAPARAATR